MWNRPQHGLLLLGSLPFPCWPGTEGSAQSQCQEHWLVILNSACVWTAPSDHSQASPSLCCHPPSLLPSRQSRPLAHYASPHSGISFFVLHFFFWADWWFVALLASHSLIPVLPPMPPRILAAFYSGQSKGVLYCFTASRSPCEKLMSKGGLSLGNSASLPPQAGSRDGLPALNTKILFPSECCHFLLPGLMC